MSYLWFLISAIAGGMFLGFILLFLGIAYLPTVALKLFGSLTFFRVLRQILAIYFGGFIGMFLFALSQAYRTKGVALWYVITVSVLFFIIKGVQYQNKATEIQKLNATLSPHDMSIAHERISWGGTGFFYGLVVFGLCFLFNNPPYRIFFHIPKILADLIS